MEFNFFFELKVAKKSQVSFCSHENFNFTEKPHQTGFVTFSPFVSFLILKYELNPKSCVWKSLKSPATFLIVYSYKYFNKKKMYIKNLQKTISVLSFKFCLKNNLITPSISLVIMIIEEELFVKQQAFDSSCTSF